MTAFKVGDLVECVDARPCEYTGCLPLCRLGELYTVQVAVICTNPDAVGEIGVVLDRDNMTVAALGGKIGWCGYSAKRFRLIRRPEDHADFIEALKALPKELVE